MNEEDNATDRCLPSKSLPSFLEATKQAMKTTASCACVVNQKNENSKSASLKKEWRCQKA